MTYEKQCPCCLVIFAAARQDKIYCSKPCKARVYRKVNLVHVKALRAKYYYANKTQELAKCKTWKQTNSVQHKAYTQKYYLEHRNEIIARVSLYNKIAYKLNPQFRLKNIIRRRLGQLRLKRIGIKSYSALYGTSIELVVKHIEAQFYCKDSRIMSWNNYGLEWQIDHIKPLYQFDLLDTKQLQEACRYTNLQPLWIEDHCIKTKQDFTNIPYGD